VEDVLSEAFTVFKKRWITFLIATLIAAVGSIFIITFRPLFWGIYIITLMSMRGEDVEIGDVFKGFDHFIKSWAIFIFGAILVFIGLIFLIIPGLLLWMLFQYAIPIALIEDRGAVDSLQKSFEIGKENLQFTVILWIVLAFINIIGYTVSVGWLITEPFTIICLCIATLKLTETEQKIEKEK
jgi:uncharacterized membrane protein